MTTDAFGGTGLLSSHVSGQGKSWVSIFGDLFLDGSGLTVGEGGGGQLYLDDSDYGLASPPARVDWALSLPDVPSPDDLGWDVWLDVLADAAVDGLDQNYLQLNLRYRPAAPGSIVQYSASSFGADGLSSSNTASTGLTGSQIVQASIDPTTGEFLINGVVIDGPFGHAPTWGTGARPAIEADFPAGMNVRITSLADAATGGGGSGDDQSSRRMSVNHSAGLGVNKSGATR